MRHLFLACVACLVAADALVAADKPNVLILYVDDMGYAQPNCYGGKLAPTPNMDRLAKEGARFTDGYVSACVCGPSRVGLMTGRYQARSGHDANSTSRKGGGLDLREVTLAQRMKDAGYKTGLVGKWHLGEEPQYLPNARGFDESFGTLANLGEGAGPQWVRNGKTVEDPPGVPVTSPLYLSEATQFIEAKKNDPFLLYVAFNAVHSPNVASEPFIKKYVTSSDPSERRTQMYQAQIAELDDSIGGILKRLDDLKLAEKTLIFMISDNGGASPLAEMGGLRGRKWLVWDGGIRVSFLARWTGKIPAGQVVREPVIQLDVMPTALAAAGVEPKPEWKLDGVNLLPLLQQQAESLDREALYFRFGVQHAVRQGDWKLVKAAVDMEPMLVNLAQDLGEQTDLSKSEPDKMKQLTALWEKWDSQMMPPRWEDKRWNGEEAKAEQKNNKNKRDDEKKKNSKGKKAKE